MYKTKSKNTCPLFVFVRLKWEITKKSTIERNPSFSVYSKATKPRISECNYIAISRLSNPHRKFISFSVIIVYCTAVTLCLSLRRHLDLKTEIKNFQDSSLKCLLRLLESTAVLIRQTSMDLYIEINKVMHKAGQPSKVICMTLVTKYTYLVGNMIHIYVRINIA